MITKINIMTLSIVKIQEAIDTYTKYTGKAPKYIVMNKDTGNSLAAGIDRDFVLNGRGSCFSQIYGVPISICNKLSFGEVEVV